MFGLTRKSDNLPNSSDHETALPGREQAIPTAITHAVTGNPLKGPYPDGVEIACFALGCYWGAERKFWQQSGIWVTAVGNMGGTTPNPTYEETCSGHTGHTETVMVVFDPAFTSYQTLLKTFWESHDPTQGMRQGNDVGTQYRSAIFPLNDQQQAQAEASKERYQLALTKQRFGEITTEIIPHQTFYFAESHHQQYLAKNPAGYCGLGGTGVSCPE